MALSKSIKQAFSTLQNQIDDDSSDYFLVTKTKIVFKKKVYLKADGNKIEELQLKILQLEEGKEGEEGEEGRRRKKRMLQRKKCPHLKKGGWKKCDIAPTYWESVTGPTWNSILNSLNLEQQYENLSESENSETSEDQGQQNNLKKKASF
ncbi:hypothetical protein C1645_832060 [Glomus cerebriforme]|uniref:Uncharacterized protein n=1 Tax=Glomus cerebriforme TaxID=658196 RepID=A0A397SKR8_9GLOM|nr:hypothetical protein C1645_832060 [Glomus cerebriforme]